VGSESLLTLWYVDEKIALDNTSGKQVLLHLARMVAIDNSRIVVGTVKAALTRMAIEEIVAPQIETNVAARILLIGSAFY
jgi:hypothetical protein